MAVLCSLLAIVSGPAIASLPAGPASCGSAGDKAVSCAKHDVAEEMAVKHKSKAEADKDVYFRAYFLYLKGTALASRVGNKVIRCHDIGEAITVSAAMSSPFDQSNATVKHMMQGC